MTRRGVFAQPLARGHEAETGRSSLGSHDTEAIVWPQDTRDVESLAEVLKSEPGGALCRLCASICLRR
jgi:hypothetical protein